ncbi:TetR/AcrR family transcriptional regulator [Pseudomonas sp. XK-1]|uniref:TetR/AcrR family transcriptional regulator n=1 Tax=Pseudomonas sp. XK-1 TaxID=3136019 RepID=UPI0031197DBE
MRKRPGQQRSQQMVDILLEASGRVIARQGLANLTTNRVAAEAGVSIGSLYQYFANKQELLEGLLERMALDMTRLIDARMTQLLAADVRTAVKMLLGEMLAFIRGGDGRYLEVVRHWQQLQTLRVVDRLEQHLSEVCRRYLLRHVREYPIENPIPVLFVIINGTLMTLVRYLALDNPPLSEEDLIDSLTEMLAAYLASAAGPRPASGQLASEDQRPPA